MTSDNLHFESPYEQYAIIEEQFPETENRVRHNKLKRRETIHLERTGFSSPPRSIAKKRPAPIRPWYNTNHLRHILDHTDDLDINVVARAEHSCNQVMDLLQAIGELAYESASLSSSAEM